METVEFSILDGIQAVCRSEVMDVFLSAVSRLCDHGELWIVLAVVLLCRKESRQTGTVLALALMMEFLCCNVILKPLIGRVRPCVVRGWTPLIAVPRDASFPSGHTAVSFAAVGALRASRWRWWPAALVMAVLIAFSRLYLYVHWPTDVLGGAVLGYALGYVAKWRLRQCT